MLKLQLINERKGSLETEIDPRDLNDYEKTLKRSEKSDGIFHEFSMNLDFNSEMREYIADVYETEGIQGQIFCNIFEWDANNYKYVYDYTATIKLNNYKEGEIFITTSLEQSGFEQQFLNLEKRDVDIEGDKTVDGTEIEPVNSFTLTLAPKTIKKKAVLRGEEATFNSDGEENSRWITSGVTPGFPSIIRLGGSNNQSDFTEGLFLGVDYWVTPGDFQEIPPNTKNFVLKVQESGNYVIDFSRLKFDLAIEVGVTAPSGLANLDNWDIRLMYQKNSNTAEELYGEVFNVGGTSADPNDGQTGDFDVILEGQVTTYPFVRFEKYNQSVGNIIKSEYFNVGDEIYIWFDSDIDFIGGGDGEKDIAYRLTPDSYFSITGDTIYPATTCKAWLIYEYLQRIVEHNTNRKGSFYSEFFGRTDLGYDQDGEGSLMAITNGGYIRKLEDQDREGAEERKLFGNWKDDYESLNAIWCLEYNFEYRDGKQVVRVEPKDYAYQKDNEVYDFNNVSECEFDVERDLYYQTVEVGYEKVEEINEINGIDEFNSLRRYGSPITNTSGELKLVSKLHASGFEIESQRRLIDKTDDSSLDDKNFLICLKRVSGGYEVLQGRDFESVTGVFDPDTAYNLTISPGRMIQRWKKVLSSNTLRSIDKTFKFTYGELNYNVTSRYSGEDTINESGDVIMSDDDALWYNEVYKYTAELYFEGRRILSDAPNGVVLFNRWDGRLIRGYVKQLKMKYEINKVEALILRAR